MTDPWRPNWGARTFIMGVINVTPDSFSGDGIYRRPDLVLERARQLLADGADVLDIGGESSRPRHVNVSTEEELERVLPAIELLAEHLSLPISIDTVKLEVARQAIRAGACIVNDVSGLADENLARLAAQARAHLIIVDCQRRQAHEGLVAEIASSLRQAAERAERLGVAPDRIILDPGLGFGKGWRENLTVLHFLSELRPLDRPLLVGPSRKGTIGRVLGTGPDDRLEGSLALAAIGIAGGADMVRVHDVRATMRVARMMDAITR